MNDALDDLLAKIADVVDEYQGSYSAYHVIAGCREGLKQSGATEPEIEIGSAGAAAWRAGYQLGERHREALSA